MKYQVGNTIFDTAPQAALASVEQYITADGLNDDEDVRDYLLSTSDEEVLEEMRDNGWQPPEGVTWDQMADALAETRRAHDLARITGDYENNGEAWWTAFDSADDCEAKLLLDPIREDDANVVWLTQEKAAEVKEWAESLPGWESDQQHAPHPLHIEGLD